MGTVDKTQIAARDKARQDLSLDAYCAAIAIGRMSDRLSAAELTNDPVLVLRLSATRDAVESLREHVKAMFAEKAKAAAYAEEAKHRNQHKEDQTR